jgi:hypothetical protein
MASGSLLLKLKRSKLLQNTFAPTFGVVIAIVGVIIGITANILLSPENVQVFMIYLGITLLFVAVMFLRVSILKLAINVFEMSPFIPRRINRRFSRYFKELLDKINSFQMVFYTDGDHPEKLNAAARYVLDNEQTKYLKVIHCYEDESKIPSHLVQNLKTIDQIYPELRIDVLLCKLPFNVISINAISKYLDIPKNYMFVGSPGENSHVDISQLGGVRVII